MLGDGPDPSGAELLGTQGGTSHGRMGLGERGGDAQLLQPLWMPPGAEEAQHLQNPAPCLAHPEGASNG